MGVSAPAKMESPPRVNERFYLSDRQTGGGYRSHSKINFN
jgi:hypothetical protein